MLGVFFQALLGTWGQPCRRCEVPPTEGVLRSGRGSSLIFPIHDFDAGRIIIFDSNLAMAASGGRGINGNYVQETWQKR